MGFIECKNLKLHNLKNINVNIPKKKLTIITGVSGSGKSTLAFDIIMQVGQTKYLSAIGMIPEKETANVYDVVGLSPTVCISQNLTRQSNPRSTVGSRTGMLAVLQSLFALLGQSSENNFMLTPAMFSQNSAMGMCFHCFGKGFVEDMSEKEREVFRSFMNSKKSVIDNLNRNLRDSYKKYCQTIGEDYTLPFSQVSLRVKETVIYGENTVYFMGTMPYLKQFSNEKSETVNQCDRCKGTGLRAEALAVKIADKNIAQYKQMDLDELLSSFKGLRNQYSSNTIALNLINTIINRINHLIEANLGYITLDRKIPTLSGGEFQRLLLSTFFDLGLSDMTYIFDEPTMGLHESEKINLVKKIKELTQKGNTVIMVEHDLGTFQYADYIIELGKGGGTEGGNVIFQGSYDDFNKSADSVIKKASSKIEMAVSAEDNLSAEEIRLENISIHNINNLSVSFPLNKLIGIAGMSGSGKSSLISFGLVPLLSIKDDDMEEDSIYYESNNLTRTIKGAEKIKKAMYVIQKPIGRSKKSIVASYVGIWDYIRQIYADEAKKIGRKYKAGHFSFNSEGACKKCGGEGQIRIAGADFTCDICNGTKYNPEILEVQYKGYNIHEIQSITVKEAASLFENANILKVVEILNDLCLGYLTLGQSTKTISGGEAQRLKLAEELCTQNAVDYLYVLDEPTTGLSCHDILTLTQILKRLVSKGNTVIVIEHDLQMLAACDHIIEMGPGSGVNGGKVISEGGVNELVSNDTSILAPYMKEFIENGGLS